MGTVYLARVTGKGGFRRLFALKVIREPLSRNPEYVEMLLQEARLASRLHHPNVVGIVDIGTVEDQHYLVMDYVEGCTLSELLEVHRTTRPPRLLVPVMLDLLTGLHAAHTLTDHDGTPLGLVHCDVSPQNMLVGTNGVCRIADFGIARATEAIVGQTSTAGEHGKVTRGKPSYLSPEQVLGRPLDHRSDVFAAGVVLWNALTGEQLFGGDTPDEILRKVLEAPIPPPSSVGLRPPACFDAVVLRALHRDRAHRHQSAEEMLIELRRVAITQDQLAPPSEVAAWVIRAFGDRLELRRRAAGISTESGRSATSKSQRAAPDNAASMSRTQMIRPGHGSHERVEARALLRLTLLGLAATGTTVIVLLGFFRPDWLRGGIVDDYGDYVARDRSPVGADDEGVDTDERSTESTQDDGAITTGSHAHDETIGGEDAELPKVSPASEPEVSSTGSVDPNGPTSAGLDAAWTSTGSTSGEGSDRDRSQEW
jgi:serine/threonine protein kinase